MFLRCLDDLDQQWRDQPLDERRFTKLWAAILNQVRKLKTQALNCHEDTQ